MLMDDVIRKIDYLRISVTDRCNLRCSYCMPKEGILNKPHNEILTFEELLRLVKLFVSLGIKRIRLTGGEPLARKDIVSLIGSLNKIDGIEDLSLTTNGALLSFYAKMLKASGLKRINISLDTLKVDRFRRITNSDSFYDVLEGIDKAKEMNLHPLKLNMVVMRGINDDEIIDFVEFARFKGLILRFIEFMKVTPLWKEGYFIPIEEVKDICAKRYRLKKTGITGSGPAEYYRVEDNVIIGFIKTDENICRNCTRLRLTSTGELKICLYETGGLRLKNLLRMGVCDEEIRDIIKSRIGIKDNTNFKNFESPKEYMYNIGG